MKDILAHPEQRIEVREGREVFQSKIALDGKDYLIRIFVDTDRNPAEVVTGYKTSKIRKYLKEA